jgi:hypothetical protein
MSEDIMAKMARWEAERAAKACSVLPIGYVLTWTICRGGKLVNDLKLDYCG